MLVGTGLLVATFYRNGSAWYRFALFINDLALNISLFGSGMCLFASGDDGYSLVNNGISAGLIFEIFIK